MAEYDDISSAIDRRRRFANLLRSNESPEERLVRFIQLQRKSFKLLQASSDGFQHFLRRNLKSRRVEVIHGDWRPVSSDRRPRQA